MLAPAQGAAKPESARSRAIASLVCAAPHAADGNSRLATNSKFAGQFQDYLHEPLVNYKPRNNNKAERDDA